MLLFVSKMWYRLDHLIMTAQEVVDHWSEYAAQGGVNEKTKNGKRAALLKI